MTDQLKVWDPGNSATISSINGDTIKAIAVLKTLNDEKVVVTIADTSAALDQVDGMGGVVGSDVGFVIGPAQPAKGIRKRDGFLKMAAQKMGGSGDASSSKSERKVWVRKVRAIGNRDFGGELKVIQGKRRGVLVAAGEDSVVKKRKVTVESGDTAVGCDTENEVCLENQAVGLVT
ncbi:hypothetical protein Q3G72_012382 [Acer saccharum]|nr:hypothetical protein Q3G72_012382 [Acer saccharum]